VPDDEWSLDLRDDYGHIFDAIIEDIGAVIMKDVLASGKGSMELSMLNSRMQAEFAAKVQADPKMRFLSGTSGLHLPQS